MVQDNNKNWIIRSNAAKLPDRQSHCRDARRLPCNHNSKVGLSSWWWPAWGVGATIDRTNVMPGTKVAYCPPLIELADAFLHQFTDHADEGRVHTDGRGAAHLDASFLAQRCGFVIQVIQHFHVIADKPNGHDHHMRKL